MKINLRSDSPQTTEQIGKALAAALPKPAVIALCGELAAGKTALSGAILRELGYGSRFTSPSYTIINEYKNASGELAAHMDAYRLSGSDELYETGYFDLAEEAELIIIEWADIIEDVLPAQTIRISLSAEDEFTRIISIDTADQETLNRLGDKLNAYTCH